MGGVYTLTIKEQYKREYRNYLRRVNRAVRQGYIVEPIQRVKRPTRASIRRLKSQTGEYIRAHAQLVDIETGELFQPIKDKKKRRVIQRSNVKLLSESLQVVSNVVDTGGIVTDTTTMSTAILPATESYEQIIDNWYRQIDDLFNSNISRLLKYHTDNLIEGRKPETRRKFAYVYSQHPDVFPDPPYQDTGTIEYAFHQIARMMELAPDSEAYKDFVSMYDIVESED